MVNRVLFIAVAAVFRMIEPVRADIVWTLPGSANQNQNLGTMKAFTSQSGGYNLTAYGYEVSPANSSTSTTLTLTTTTDLYGKSSGTGETGVGIYGTTDNEIGVHHAVALDLSSSYLNANGDVTITIGSVQKNEGFAVFGGTLPGGSFPSSPYKLTDYIGQVVNNTSSSTVQYTFTVTPSEMEAAHDVLYVSAVSGNVVIESVSIASVPEPGTITMLLTGLASVTGLGWYRRRKAS